MSQANASIRAQRILLNLSLISCFGLAQENVFNGGALEDYLRCASVEWSTAYERCGHPLQIPNSVLHPLNFGQTIQAIPAALPTDALNILQKRHHGFKYRTFQGSIQPSEAKLNASFYIESRCPDTTRFIRYQLGPAWEKLGSSNHITWNIIVFGKAKCTPKGDHDFSCICQHGTTECELNQLMNCVIKRLHDINLYFPVIYCIQNRRNLKDAQQHCIEGQLESAASIMACASGAEGRGLLADAGAQTSQLQPPLNFVPWITINGFRSVNSVYNLFQELCNQLIPQPDVCLRQNFFQWG
ncbi:unnamed protein product [Anisakis simplex]|uniref:GILT-like protein (inferred by orthology to a C. elegans protein) n=1 Tax=Anisakis simplex TaxID=6269 RepID=A0A0M3JUZ8_ANISI|nr:unnamed protein product [Anisakis simplex]